jgi:predicted amidophosphoribosyltransferase
VGPLHVDVCEVCHGAAAPGTTVCGDCAQRRQEVPKPTGQVVPITLYRHGPSAVDSVLYDYKSLLKGPQGRDDANQARWQLTALLACFLDAHHACIERKAGGRWDAITTVPPTLTAPRDGSTHPLAGIIDRLDQVHLPARQGRRAWTNQRLDVLAPGPDAPLLAKQQASQDGFVVHHPDRVRGRRLLLVDDLLISGAHLQSAASALATAGAQVAAVAVGRRLNVRQEYPRRLWDQLGREQADWRKAQQSSSTRQGVLDDPRSAERHTLAYFATCCLEAPRPHQPGLNL